MSNATTAATVTAETEDRVYVTAADGAVYALRYWNIPARFGIGDAVELTITAPPLSTELPGAGYVAREEV